MVDIAPFRAIRYQVDCLDDVVAPPYDVIQPSRQDQLYQQSPHNIVRIDLNRPEPQDEELARYERAKDILSSWRNDKVLAQDEKPGFYVLSQTFTGPDGIERIRTGFFGCARLTKFGEGPIMPHERTLKGPKLDRLRLFRATEANLSPIFSMYQDPDHQVLDVLKSATEEKPDAVATMDGVLNRMWIVTDATKIEKIADVLRPGKLYIADGHHRYETALAYRDERRAQDHQDGAGYESVMMFMAAVEDPGMVVFPTHRLVHGLEPFDETRIQTALRRFFDFAPGPDSSSDLMSTLETSGEGACALGMVTRTGSWLLSARPDAPWDDVPELSRRPEVRNLDVAILHSVVLEHVLEISKEAQASQSNLRYSKDAGEAFSAPRGSGDIQIAFLMNPTKISEVLAVSNAGEVMPQKSTFFYPKIPSGLVLYPLS